jgi:hypothetical protein
MRLCKFYPIFLHILDIDVALGSLFRMANVCFYFLNNRIQAIDPREKKIRRLGGREQITSDGRHLVDGISFGRPYLRRPADRPTVTIPPRKKARLQLEWEPAPQVFTDAHIEDEDSEDDGDYVEGGAGDDEDTSEDEDMGDGERVAIDDEDKENVPERQVMLRTEFDNADEEDVEEEEEEEEEPVGLGEEVEVLEEEEWHGFDGSQDIQNGVEEDIGIIADMGDGRRRSKRLSGTHTSSSSGLSWLTPDEEGHVTRRGRRNKRRTGDPSSETSTKLSEEVVEVLQDSGSEEDNDSENSDSDDSGSGESITRLSQPTTTKAAEKVKPQGVSNVDEDETSSSGTSSDETTSDEDSDLESDSDSEPEESSLSSSSSSSSSSDDESVVEQRSTPRKHDSPLASAKNNTAELQTKPSSVPTKPLHQQPEESGTKAPQKVNPPGQGSAATQRTNRKIKLRKLKRAGKLPPNATVADLDVYLASIHATSSDAIPGSHVEDAEMIEVPVQEPEQADFEAERQRLLNAIADGGVDVNLLRDTTNEQVLIPTETTVDGVAGETMTEPPRKRSKLDISSTRRLLFGSLGVRAPKTKEDEEATRCKLAGHSRTPSAKLKERDAKMQDQSSSTIAGDDTLVNKVLVPDSQADDETWKKKIVLKAVECCYDGVELSAPPFPFVQRWDPQQQTRGQKRKRGNGGYATHRHSDQRYHHQQEKEELDVVLNYDDDEEESDLSEHGVKTDNGAIRDQLMREANGLSATSPQSDSYDDGYPPVPADIEKRPTLEKKNATFASFIAYKELRMDKSTNWKPEYSPYIIAHIDKVVEIWKEGEDGQQVVDEEDAELFLHLAKRDWKKKERNFDKETGERIYDKFEMPGADDDEGEDDGKRTFKLSVLMYRKLVKAGEKYYPQPEKGSQAEDDAMELSAPAEEEPEDLTILPEPSLEPQVERRSSFSVDRETSEWPSEGENVDVDDAPVGNPGNETIGNLLPDLGFIGEPAETQQTSVSQVDGSFDHPGKNQESSWVTEEASDDESFFNGEAVVQETPAASFQENPNISSTESVPDILSSATRADISNLIKDAGFRQSVDSDIAWQPAEEVESSSMQTATRAEQGGNESFDSQNSFENRPPTKESAVLEDTAMDRSSLNGDENGNQDSAGDIPSPKFNGFASSSPGLHTSPQRPRIENSPKGASSAKGTPNGKNKFKGFDTPGYPKLPTGADNGADANHNGDDSFDRDLDDSNMFGDDGDVFGDSTDVVEDSIVVSGNIQDGQEVNAPRHEIEEDDSLLKPISLSKDNSATSYISFGLNDGSNDGELPDLDQIFSSTVPARSYEISPPTTKRSQQKFPKESKKPEGEDIRQWPFSDDATPAKPSKPEPKKKKKLFSSKYADFAASSQDRDLDLFRPFGRPSTPPLPPVSKSSSQSQSQMPKGLQIVDLTQMSSDPVSGHSSDNDSNEESRDTGRDSPKRAGWIKKEILSQTSQMEGKERSTKKSRKIRKSEI